MSAPTFTFSKATKRAARARVCLDGPSGAGKTFTALIWAAILGARIALIDTERGSASLYSDRFDFDVLEMSPPYDPNRLAQALVAAAAQNYDVIVVDSASHFWEAEGGVLDIVDGAAQRAHGNSFAGWKVGTPAYRHLIDTMLGLDAHVIMTMRSKTEWILETNDKGKQVPRRIGMAPVMRQGIEYEFTIVGDLDIEHRLIISKSRAEPLADLVVQPGRAGEAAETFKRWLESGEPVAARADVEALKDRLNALASDVRVDAKRGFVERFGQPEYLLASRLAEASTYVATFEDSQGQPDPVLPSGGSGNGGNAAETPPAPSPDMQRETEAEGAGEPSAPAEPAPKAGKSTLRDAQKRAGAANNKNWRVAAVCGELGLSDDDRHVLVKAWTDGRTESSKDLTPTEAAQLTWGLEKIKNDGSVAAGDIDAVLAKAREVVASLAAGEAS